MLAAFFYFTIGAHGSMHAMSCAWPDALFSCKQKTIVPAARHPFSAWTTARGNTLETPETPENPFTLPPDNQWRALPFHWGYQ
jgi:hypothetical protein